MTCERLTSSEVGKAAYRWIEHVQQFCFPKEFLALQSNNAATRHLSLI